MRKDEFMREMEVNLDKVSESERKEILYDYEEHFRIAKENGKAEEAVCMELGNPKEIASSYRADYKDEKKSLVNRREIMKSTPVYNSNSRLLKPVGVFVIAAGIILMLLTVHSIYFRYNNAISNNSENKIHVGEMNIDDSGIRGEGINIDKDGISMPGVKIDDKGISTAGIKIDDNGISTSSMKIDNNGISAPGIKIDANGISAPGIKIDDNGISMPGITIDSNGIKIN